MGQEFEIEIYIIVQAAMGELDRLLADTVYAIREIANDTVELNRYRYVEEMPS